MNGVEIVDKETIDTITVIAILCLIPAMLYYLILIIATLPAIICKGVDEVVDAARSENKINDK